MRRAVELLYKTLLTVLNLVGRVKTDWLSQMLNVFLSMCPQQPTHRLRVFVAIFIHLISKMFCVINLLYAFTVSVYVSCLECFNFYLTWLSERGIRAGVEWGGFEGSSWFPFRPCWPNTALDPCIHKHMNQAGTGQNTAWNSRDPPCRGWQIDWEENIKFRTKKKSRN